MLLVLPTIFQMCTASTSLIASSAIVIMVSLVADGGLRTPYRRIIFALSLSDVFQSGALVFGPFMLPKGTSGSWAKGTEFTCELDGFFLMMGTYGILVYTLALCLFYLFRTKFGWTNEKFKKSVEFKLHAFCLVTSATISIAAFATDNFSPVPTRSFCFVAAYPSFCKTFPEKVGECTRGKENMIFITIITYAVPALCVLGVIVSFMMVCSHIIYRQRLMNYSVLRLSPASANSRDATGHDRHAMFRLMHYWQSLFDERRENELESEYMTRKYLANQITQMCLYVCFFFSTFFLVWIVQAMYFLGYNPSMWMLYLMPLFYPVGGLFNIFIYTRLSVKRLRTRYSEYSFWKAFWLVLRAGGEMPSENNNRLQESVSQEQDKRCYSCIFKCVDFFRDQNAFNGISDLSSSVPTSSSVMGGHNQRLDDEGLGDSRIRSTSACKYESEDDERLSIIEEISLDSDDLDLSCPAEVHSTNVKSVPSGQTQTEPQHYLKARLMFTNLNMSNNLNNRPRYRN